MCIVTLGISSRRKINKRFIEAFEEKFQGTFIRFESPAILLKKFIVVSFGFERVCFEKINLFPFPFLPFFDFY